jgi:hypothetical protein
MRFLGAVAKLPKAIIGFIMSVVLHGTVLLSLDGLSWNLIFDFFFLVENLSRKLVFFLKKSD